MTKPIHRRDYRPPDFAIPNVALRFDLDPEATIVTATLTLERRGAGPLVLDGQALELLSITLDGEPLAESRYDCSSDRLIIADMPDQASLEMVTRINPGANTVLEGLYISRGLFCTQCEAEGFRRITYFLDRPDILARYRTTIVAERARYPLLLSNGNLVDQGDLGDSRHYAVWDDPFPKPSYLFALVAGHLDWLGDHFTTRSGRQVHLRLYTEHHDIGKCAHALEALKKAMAWDEDVFGLEYDLDLFNIVAVRDFNMGAMENKSLNIFNTKLLLASPETATDADYGMVESVIAHEYFHNWTGNRVTCRDWFQLSLKEGLTVFREQLFAADMGSAPVERVETVRFLRAHQFAEDDGPMAHPVRPESYVEINNFYSSTVYEKGAEVIRMLRTLLGADGFRAGMDLYIARHDGTAATCDDFLEAMADANGVDLTQFSLWYSQAGTPRLKARGHYDSVSRTYTLDLTQTVPPTPSQPRKQPMLIPLQMGLLGTDGEPIPLKLSTDEVDAPVERVITVSAEHERIVFHDVPAPPVPSLLRGFSAPVRLDTGYSRDDLSFLMRHDTDLFNRWEAGHQLAVDCLLERSRRGAETIQEPLDPVLAESFRGLLSDDGLDRSLVAEILDLPSEAYLAQQVEVIDVDALHGARRGTREQLCDALWTDWRRVYEANSTAEPYYFSAEEAARRKLKNRSLSYLALQPGGIELAEAQFRAADNMTDEEAAFAALSNAAEAEWEGAIAAFFDKWQDEPLVIDKWFAIQARADRPDTLERVKGLTRHPAYEPDNPNRARALLGAFGSNRKWFHALSGEGYAFLQEAIATTDSRNPRLAARLLQPFEMWRRFDSRRREMMRVVLTDLSKKPSLSRDLAERIGKSLQPD